MYISIQKTELIFEGQSITVWTERDIRGQETGWIIEHGGWIYEKMNVTGSVYEATKAGVEAVLRIAGKPAIGIRSEVSCEMLSTQEVERVVAKVFGRCSIEEF
ncbi:hypothetical protein QAO71_17435 (plasmid) [Halopseudomonas sp. SMJS2]|uniref:hypothetical protein n=1 Tax=Halopseudomonas sp. SMJS2 TaxID=3041098 RepID=UPI002452F037|nr:hypothetical protein [Halopseudomonas sp. SMJS2]WGK63552.1 hypothetical protein QAO71_17435 [Halopseudomonas sp. SMJS2]